MSNVTSMSSKFYGCSRLENVDVSGFVIGEDTDTLYIFKRAGVTAEEAGLPGTVYGRCRNFVIAGGEERRWFSRFLMGPDIKNAHRPERVPGIVCARPDTSNTDFICTPFGTDVTGLLYAIFSESAINVARIKRQYFSGRSIFLHHCTTRYYDDATR